MRSEVPDVLASAAMRRGELLRRGVTDSRLRSQAVRRPFRGVHADATEPPGVLRRIRDVVPLLPPGGVVGGWAAAWLHGARWFDGCSGTVELPVLVCVPGARRMRSRPGARVLRSELRDDDTGEVAGVPVTSAVRTALDLARLSETPRRGVVAVDALWAAGVTTGPAVLAHLEERPRLRGARVAREAAALAVVGVRSPMETELRMLWCLDAGLPVPLVDHRVVDLDGHHLGRPDLLDEEAGVVGEFDGRGHLALDVSTVDHVRQEGLERHGLVVARSPSLDVRAEHVRRTVWRLQDARRRGLGRPGPTRSRESSGSGRTGPATLSHVHTLTACHTADLAAATRAEVRALLDAAFDDFTDEDFEHGLGGWHVLAHDGGVLVGHGAVVRRQFLLGGRALPVGYVENVAVAAPHRRGGVASAVMDELERVVLAGHGAGFLAASEEGALLYERRGWRVWRGPLSVLAVDGVRRTPDEDGGVRVLDPGRTWDVERELVCEWRSGDVW